MNHNFPILFIFYNGVSFFSFSILYSFFFPVIWLKVTKGYRVYKEYINNPVTSTIMDTVTYCYTTVRIK